jgi:Abnormal spindle-like microcephaly-assoc'd, ASPM-SPD-2-Hydin
MFPFPSRYCLAPSLSLILVILTPSAGAASGPDLLAAQDGTDSRHSAGPLVCQPCKMDFGKVKVGETKALPVVLSNQGRVPVTISLKEKNAPWVSPHGLSLPYKLLPGGRVKFHLIYTPRDGRAVNGHITYHSNAGNHLLPISVTAQSSAGTLSANPLRLDFGNVAVGSTASKSQTITNTGSASVMISQITESGSGYSVSNVTTPLTLAPGHSVTFSVQFTPPSASYDSASLIALSNATNYRMSVVETGTGTAGGTVSISPASLSFGNVAVGASKSKTLTLTANGAAMTIKSDALNTPEYSISGLSLPLKLGAGKSVSFQATFTPQAAGGANANLSLAVTNPSATIKAALSGTGTAAPQHSVNLSWTPDSSPVAGYNVYRSGKTGGPYVKLNSPVDTATAYLDTSVASGNTYYYEVTAVNDQGAESNPSKPVGATIP